MPATPNAAPATPGAFAPDAEHLRDHLREHLRDHLRRCLAVFRHLAPALAERVVAYVADGGDAGVLSELSSHAAASAPLLNQSRSQAWYDARTSDPALYEAVNEGTAARDALYRAVPAADGAPSTTTALLARMGRVLRAADDGTSVRMADATAPDWLHYLLHDALGVSLSGGIYGHDKAELPALRPTWDVRLLRALLEDARLAGDLALHVIFGGANGKPEHPHLPYPHLAAPGALDDDMLAHPDAVEQAARELSPSGRFLLAQRIGASAALTARFAGVLAWLAVGDGKALRTVAASQFGRLDAAARLPHLAALLRDGAAGERVNAVELLARIDDPAVRPLLEATLANETHAGVRRAIDAALLRLDAGADGDDGALPPPPPPIDILLGEDAIDLLAHNRTRLADRHDRERRDAYLQVGTDTLRDALRALNGDLEKSAVLDDHRVHDILVFDGDLEARKDFGPLQAMCLDLHDPWERRWRTWPDVRLNAWIARQDPDRVDLRQLAALAVRTGATADVLARACLGDWRYGSELPQDLLPPDRVWPYLAMHLDLVDAGLGVTHGDAGVSLAATLSALDTFPVILPRWRARLLELALGEGKTHRAEAQHLLGKAPGIGKVVADALKSGGAAQRIEGARWLRRLGDRGVVPALYALLDKEANDTVRAALMTALETLGEDLAPRLAPDVLLREARKGLKAKPPAGMAWLTAELLPACAWADGTPVAPEIVHWWIILSAKLKEPAANALLVRYAGLLDADSRTALGRFVLQQFIARDTARPSLEEALAYATERAAQWSGFASQTPAEQQRDIEWWKQQRLAEYRGSAIGEKGMLALSFTVPGHELADTIRQFMRDHHLRRAQIEALLDAASVSDDPAAIQFMLATARRHRTASVKEKARMLVDVIAERNGWTQDQLADRTVPTGGLDETGRMTFQYGAREFTVVLDEKLKPVLLNAEGKTIAALPEPRKDDPEDAIKEGRQLFTACKKEVKQAVEQQTARLYEAMCAGRIWSWGEWDEYLRRHPVVGRLAQRLAWTRLAGDGAVLGVFRPTEDGSLIDADDEEVALAPDARIGLAHASLLDAAAIKAWNAHFKDYKITPLFQQLKHQGPALADGQADAVDDRLGWLGETYPLRGAFTKLGYQRAAAEEGTFFDEYTKDFASAGLRARITFTGNTMPEENRPAALKTLSFARLAPRRGARSGGVPLAEVPRALLAEAYGDYLTVAATCQGFDPEWESKAGW